MADSLNRGVGGSLPDSQAKQWIANYGKQIPPDGIKAYFFGSSIIEAILQQKDCVGIRVYFAQDDTGISKIILVGAKANGNNIWPSTTDSTPDGIMADEGWPCPPRCPEN